MKIIIGTERSPIDVDISEIIKDGGKLNILPQVKNYFSIDYKPRDNKLSLAAKGYIGVIPVTTDLAIDIRPKFSIKNLTTMVSVAQGKFRSLSYFSRKYNEKENTPEIVYEFLVESFIAELQTLYDEGIYKEYLLRNDELSNIKGRLDTANSIRKLWGHGKFHKAYSSFFEHTSNTPLNQLIKFTIHYCLTNLPPDLLKQEHIYKPLIQFYDGFKEVEFPIDSNFLEEVFSIIKNNKIPMLRSYYINICEVCRLIITGTGIDFDNHGTTLNLNSFVVDMENIFEQFLLNTTREYKTVIGEDILILDGNDEGKKQFLDPPGTATGTAKPDIIIKDQYRTLLIADAKYKPSSKESDRYQVISHALSFSCKTAALILPSKNGQTYIEKLGSIGSKNTIDVYEIFIDLSAENLQLEQEKLMQLIANTISGDIIGDI
ncbi:5-methylcytosine-specific restriction enzyme subunit McrC [Marinomonas alcarazii]|uniref:5-methylcytosine-specific restriction enzyme subunit McrC n=1 Tax=Marinomonas alcarazii TaxID=491949 RepID=A0A318UY35_9GAMM|nr:restriction endonuclease [Marinomonas alcarazii]PYF78935.1 5-methylcytosine-specific restriction enzyme subunit McrC [Marinomonas alcarazii]